MTIKDRNHSSQRVQKKHKLVFLTVLIFFLIITISFIFLNNPLKNAILLHRQASYAAYQVENLGGRVSWNPKMEILETICYDKAISRITDVHFNNPAFPDEKWTVLLEIPQRFGLQVSGLGFTDNSLLYLKEVQNMNYLVLFKTSVTEMGIANLQKSLPNLRVMYGYPHDPNYRIFPAINSR